MGVLQVGPWPLAISEDRSRFRVPVCWTWRGPPTCAVQPATAFPEVLQTQYLNHVDELPAEFDQKP